MVAIGIIGLPNSGKTTVFNALTRGHSQTGSFQVAGLQPRIGIAKVPSPELQWVAELERSRRVVAAEMEFIDIPGTPEGSQTQGLAGESLNILQRCEALALIVRAFDNPSVTHVESSVDHHRDIATLNLEMLFSDMAILERREERIQVRLRGSKAMERDELGKEVYFLQQIREGLEKEVPVREQALPQETLGVIENYHLLTAKPLLIVVNIGETDLAQLDTITEKVQKSISHSKVGTAAICGKLEEELVRMNDADAIEFRVSLGTGESVLGRTMRMAHDVLGLISFLTAGEKEARAWSITQGTTAHQAASKIHTDIQRGFIRAEVVGFDDLVRVGSITGAKRLGLLRAEGKGYIMRDSDVVNFLFNI